MADLDKHLNLVYSGASPLHLGDRYYAQDLIRDLNYSWDVTGQAVKRTLGTFPVLLQGGVVTMGAGDTLNITEAWGVCSYDVEVPDTFAALPPSKMTVTIARMVHAAAQTNLAMAAATKDGATPNYIKLAYTETNGNSRTRARAAGSYNYERVPSYTYSITSAAPTVYEVSLGTVIIAAGGAGPWTLSLATPYNMKKVYDDLDVIERIYGTSTETIAAATATRTILDTDTVHTFFANCSTRAQTLVLPTLAENLGKIYTFQIATAGGWAMMDGEGAETINGLANFIMYAEGNYVTVIGQTSGWKILSAHGTYKTGWIHNTTFGNREFGTITVTTKTVNANLYTVGELITEETSGNTWRIDSITAGDPGAFVVRAISGTGLFTINKKLTGTTSGVNTIQVGATTTNQDCNVIHNFGLNMVDIHRRILISTDLTEALTHESGPASYLSAASIGYMSAGIDTNRFVIQTGANTFLIYVNNGAWVTPPASTHYYNIISEVII